MTLPRISLVTPVFNSAKYIEQTICSVLGQNYPNLEYFIADGGSTDGTVDIIRNYQSQISGWLSEPDNGMYEALSKGFARTSGEITGWISATDQLHTGGLAVVGSVFRDLPEVEWITARPTGFSQEGMTVLVLDLPRWSRSRFLAGANRYIQQESTFWRRSLWEKAGSRLDCSQRIVGDFDLWLRFFRHAKLYSVDALIGGYRVHAGQLSFQDMEANHRIHDQYIAAELASTLDLRSVKLFRRLNKFAQSVPKLRGLWNRTALRALYRFPGPDLPPVIRFDGHSWQLSS
jgi:glycosyltransferase involved in cell wall biosynthesis